MKYYDELERILSESKGERAASAFLSQHPNIVRWAVCWTGGHNAFVLKEFPFGSQFKADFVVATSYSGVWEVHLIELEPHDDKVITKDGLPSNRLNKAITQIKDWQEYIKQNPVSFRQDLANWCTKRDLLGFQELGSVPINNTGDYLSAPDTHIRLKYYIFIGSRANIDKEQRKRMNQFSDHPLTIFTYGRIFDIARNMDRVDMGESGVRLTESEEG
ncbi:MAG: DUF4263 domain-containing protein [Sphingobacteriales bacterium]|nr:MAG: DUF4263 domain-containing protein [Sphingobacteriales bacterium]